MGVREQMEFTATHVLRRGHTVEGYAERLTCLTCGESISLEPLPSSSGQSVLSAGWPRQEETAPGEAAQMRVGPAVSEPEKNPGSEEICPKCGLRGHSLQACKHHGTEF
jgi:hypothetical protein